MLPSFAETNTITVILYSPIIRGGSYIRTIDDEINSYTHTISIDGGFISAGIEINVSPSELEDWLTNGLGRHIVAYGIGGDIIWEGFVDNVSASLGNITIERGRLTDICNRCSVIYTRIFDDPENPASEPITASGFPTTIAEDTASQEKYGIWEKVVTGGTILQSDAEYLRDTYLEDNKEPMVSHSPVLAVEGGSDAKITLDCKGYIEWLKSYVYENDIAEDEDYHIETSDKIKLVLAEDPNGIFSNDVTNINYNGCLAWMSEQNSRTAYDVIAEMVKFGDGSSNRWIFGIFENRTPYYYAFQSSIEYYYYIHNGKQRILNLSEAEIPSCNVRPGKIVFIPDTYLGGLVPTHDFRTDPRVMFLEQVTFTAPNKLELQGRKIRRFEQLQAYQGLV